MNLNVVGLVRARNEARWIGRCIQSMRPLCRNIIVMDDRSEDDTAAAARQNGAVVLKTPYDRFHEADDKQWLYEQARSLNPDWCLMLDGDEMLAPGTAKMIEATIDTGLAFMASYRFRIVYLWDRENQIRVDRWYGHFTRASLWHCRPNQHFSSTYKNGMHCGNTPAGLACDELPGADILHFGYMHREDRIRKFWYYNDLDPGNQFEDQYKHMVIGDLPQFPPETVAKWAGPLELAEL